MRTKQRASIKGSTPKTEEKEFKQAYILPAEFGDRMKNVLGEIPMKFGPLVGPMIDGLNRAMRGDIKVQIPVAEEHPEQPTNQGEKQEIDEEV